MKNPTISRLLTICFVFLSVAFTAPKIFAADRWIPATVSSSLTKILRDDILNRIYLADNNYLYVIDGTLETVLTKIPIAGPVSDMALNKSFSLLDIAAQGRVTRIDLNQSKVVAQYSLPGLFITSVAFDYQNNVYVWASPYSVSNPQWGWAYKLNSTGTQILQKFGKGADLSQQFYNGLLKTDVTGTKLYIGEQGVSPLSISKFNILDADPTLNQPIFVATNAFGALGSNLKDFAVYPRYDAIYIAAGAPYGIQVVNDNTLAFETLLNTGSYPSGVGVNILRDTVYGIKNDPYQNTLYEFNAQTFALENTYALQSKVLNGTALGIAIDFQSDKAFIIDGTTYGGPLEVEVVDVNSETPSCTLTLGSKTSDLGI